MIAGVKSPSSNRVDQIYVTDFGDVVIYHLTHRKDAHTSLPSSLMDDVVPEHLHLNNA